MSDFDEASSPLSFPGDGGVTMSESSPVRVSTVESLSQEPVITDGVAKNVHVVAKNLPFKVHLHAAEGNFATPNSRSGGWLVSPTLCFDSPNGTSVEDFMPVQLPSKFVTTKSFFDPQHPEKMSIEVRIFILSSHYNDGCFRVRVNVSRRGSKTPEAQIISEAIRVVSKPSQVARGKERRNGPTDLSKKQRGMRGPQVAQELAQLRREVQQFHEKQLAVTRSIEEVVTSNRKRPLEQDDVIDLESALRQAVRFFQASSPEERARKIQRVVDESPFAREFGIAVGQATSAGSLSSREAENDEFKDVLRASMYSGSLLDPMALNLSMSNGMACLSNGLGLSNGLSDLGFD